MIKSIKAIMRQDREQYRIPRRVQDVIPIQAVWPDGIFKVGNKFSKTYRFSDINYMVASREDKEGMFLTYSELLNSLDSAATTKLTICNRRQNRANFEQSILMPMRGDGLDEYRREYNQMLIDKATGANGIIQEKYVTVSIYKKDIEAARAYFARIGADLSARFAALGSKCVELTAADRLRILHDFYRAGEEETFRFDMADMARLGHDFKDYNTVHQVVMSRIEGHSKKPDEVRRRIERLMGDVPRVELFARQYSPGWDVWGNQVSGSIDIDGWDDFDTFLSDYTSI